MCYTVGYGGICIARLTNRALTSLQVITLASWGTLAAASRTATRLTLLTGRTPWSARPRTSARQPASTSASRRGITTCGRVAAVERRTTRPRRHATRRAGRGIITRRALSRGRRFQSRPLRGGRSGTTETPCRITRCQLGPPGLTQGKILLESKTCFQPAFTSTC